MKYFKLIRGYGAEDYIEIDESELDKAYYCFLEKKDSIYSGGAIRGSQIMAIQPDFHRIMKWNRGYKLNPEDYQELNSSGVDKEARDALYTSKQKVTALVKQGRANYLIESHGEKNLSPL